MKKILILAGMILAGSISYATTVYYGTDGTICHDNNGKNNLYKK